jgi:hypothetical protein
MDKMSGNWELGFRGVRSLDDSNSREHSPSRCLASLRHFSAWRVSNQTLHMMVGVRALPRAHIGYLGPLPNTLATLVAGFR